MTQEERDQQYKNRIITELFNSGIIQKKIPNACNRNNVGYGSKIHEDVLGEVFLHVSRLKAKDVIEMYEDDHNGLVTPSSRLTKLATRIMSLQGFARAKDTLYPKQSVMTSILYASNFTHKKKDAKERDDHGYIPDAWPEDFGDMVGTDETNFLLELWELIQGQLSSEENKFLETMFTEKKGRGKYKKEISMQLDKIKEHIKQIVEESKIII